MIWNVSLGKMEENDFSKLDSRSYLDVIPSTLLHLEIIWLLPVIRWLLHPHNKFGLRWIWTQSDRKGIVELDNRIKSEVFCQRAGGPGNFARRVLKLLNPALRAIAVSSMLNANAAFGSLDPELRESIPLCLSSLPTTRTSFNGRMEVEPPLVHLIRKFPPASVQIENMLAIYSKCLPSEGPSLV